MITAGDEFIRAGDWPAAWSAYESARHFGESHSPAELHYRLGLSAELMEEFELALAEYRAASAESVEQALQVSALLGEARALQQLERPVEARHILSQLWLTVARLDDLPAIAHQCRYALAELHAQECLRSVEAPPWSDSGMLPPDGPAEMAVRWLELSESRNSTEEQRGPLAIGAHVVQQNRVDPDGIQLQVRLPRATLEDAVQTLCAASGLRTLWTPAAKQLAIGRAVELSIGRTSLAACLDVLSADSGLSWTCVGTEIQVASLDEVAPVERAVRNRRAAVQLANHAILQHEDSLLTPPALLWLGNLAAIGDRPAEAAAYYEQLLRQFPRTPVTVEAWFNLAKARLALGDQPGALDAFLHVIDSGRDDQTVAVAYIYAGRLRLEAGDARRAVNLCTRAVVMSEDHQLRGLAVLGLSAAHFMAGDPAAADLVLMEQRDALADSGHSKVAAFLGAAARHRAANEPGLRAREARNLLFAVTDIHPSDFFGRYGWYLIGRAYADLGLDERSAEIYEKAVAQAPRPAFADAMMLALASGHLSRGRADEARLLLAAVADAGDTDSSMTARIQLCELSARDGISQVTLDRCRSLLAECKGAADRRRLLRMMGQVYQQAGDHPSAVMCFTGIDPDSPLPNSVTPTASP